MEFLRSDYVSLEIWSKVLHYENIFTRVLTVIERGTSKALPFNSDDLETIFTHKYRTRKFAFKYNFDNNISNEMAISEAVLIVEAKTKALLPIFRILWDEYESILQNPDDYVSNWKITTNTEGTRDTDIDNTLTTNHGKKTNYGKGSTDTTHKTSTNNSLEFRNEWKEEYSSINGLESSDSGTTTQITDGTNYTDYTQDTKTVGVKNTTKAQILNELLQTAQNNLMDVICNEIAKSILLSVY